MRKLLLRVLGIVLLAASCASGEPSGSVPEDGIEITMRDSVFDPKHVTVKRGEPVTFVFVNRGSLEHEAFIGSAKEQEAHAREMAEADDGGHGGHGETSSGVTVKPGRSEMLEHTFTEAGDTLIGCHVPGHYDAGMRVEVTVT